MKKKITITLVAIVALLVLFVSLSTLFFKPEPITPEVSQISNEEVNQKNCALLGNEFIKNSGYEQSGMRFYPILVWNEKIRTCLLSVELANEPKEEGEKINYVNDLFDLTNRTTIATFRGITSNPEDTPKVNVCVFYGNKEHTCKSLSEYLYTVDQILKVN